MNRFLNRTLLAGILGLLGAMAWAEEQGSGGAEPGLVISSGGEGGGYWSAAARLQAVVQGLGAGAENLPSTGSLANLEAMTDSASPVNLAFAQADALQYFLYDKPGARSRIDVLENIGQECVFIITAAGSAAKTDEDLQGADNYRLGIGSHTSGVAVTFNYMSRLVPEFSEVEVVYGDTRSAVEQLGTPAATVDAVMVVHRPREHSPELDLALRNAERYQVLAIGDKRLTKTPDDGREVYRAMNLAIPVGEDAPPARVDTICVKGLLVANREKLSEGQQNLMTDVVNSHWMRVFATQ